MNERIEALKKLATKEVWGNNPYNGSPEFDGYELDADMFAELIVRECMKESMDEIVSDEDIAQEKDPLIREYLTGNNQGIVDAVVRFRNHFGVEE